MMTYRDLMAAKADRLMAAKPNWSKWRLIPCPELRQCVALSLNIDPDSIEIDPVFGRDPILPRRLREFRDRIDIARENLHRTLRCTAVAMDRPLQSRVSLRDFAAWVRQIGWDAPQELLAIGHQRPQNVNWDYWKALDLWPLDTACKLICGYDPSEPTRREDIENRDINNRLTWVNAYHQAVSAIKAGNLNVFDGEVTPAEFLAWVQGKDIPISGELSQFALCLATTKEAIAKAEGTGKRGQRKQETEARHRKWQEEINMLARKHPDHSHTHLCRVLAKKVGAPFQTLRRHTRVRHG